MSVTKMNVMKRRILAYRMWTEYETGTQHWNWIRKGGSTLG